MRPDRERGEYMHRSSINRLVKERLKQEEQLKQQYLQQRADARAKVQAQQERGGPLPRKLTKQEIEEELEQWERDREGIATDASIHRAMEAEQARREARGARVVGAAHLIQSLGRDKVLQISHQGVDPDEHSKQLHVSGVVAGSDASSATVPHALGAHAPPPAEGLSWGVLGTVFGGQREKASGALLHASMNVEQACHVLTEQVFRGERELLIKTFDELTELALLESRAALHKAPNSVMEDVWRNPAVTAVCVRMACSAQYRSDLDVARAMCDLVRASVDGRDAAANSRKQRCVDCGGLTAVITALHHVLHGSTAPPTASAEGDEASITALSAGGYAARPADAKVEVQVYQEAYEAESGAFGAGQQFGTMLLKGIGGLGATLRDATESLSQLVVGGGEKNDWRQRELATMAACRALLAIVRGFDEASLHRKELAIDMYILEALLSLTQHLGRQDKVATDATLYALIVELATCFWAHMQHYHAKHHETLGQSIAFLWQAPARRRRAEARLELGANQFGAICHAVKRNPERMLRPYGRGIMTLQLLRILMPTIATQPRITRMGCIGRALQTKMVVESMRATYAGQYPDSSAEYLLEKLSLGALTLHVKAHMRKLSDKAHDDDGHADAGASAFSEHFMTQSLTVVDIPVEPNPLRIYLPPTRTSKPKARRNADPGRAAAQQESSKPSSGPSSMPSSRLAIIELRRTELEARMRLKAAKAETLLTQEQEIAAQAAAAEEAAAAEDRLSPLTTSIVKKLSDISGEVLHVGESAKEAVAHVGGAVVHAGDEALTYVSSNAASSAAAVSHAAEAVASSASHAASSASHAAASASHAACTAANAAGAALAAAIPPTLSKGSSQGSNASSSGSLRNALRNITRRRSSPRA